jgi:hypothetical protein
MRGILRIVVWVCISWSYVPAEAKSNTTAWLVPLEKRDLELEKTVTCHGNLIDLIRNILTELHTTTTTLFFSLD